MDFTLVVVSLGASYTIFLPTLDLVKNPISANLVLVLTIVEVVSTL